jgi:gluconokinase
MAEEADTSLPDFVLVMGVSGCGKSTVGAALANALGGCFIEGDRLHPKENIAAMSVGLPLNDKMRLPWLQAICTAALDSSATCRPVVIACSALKRHYRDLLRARLPGLVPVYLDGSLAVLRHRMDQRSGHFMPPSLLASQLSDLEPPDLDENAIRVDIASPAEMIVADVLYGLRFTGVAPGSPGG